MTSGETFEIGEDESLVELVASRVGGDQRPSQSLLLRSPSELEVEGEHHRQDEGSRTRILRQSSQRVSEYDSPSTNG